MSNYNTPMVRHSGHRLITTSLAISQLFEKKHKDVLRAVENLGCSPAFAERNFAPGSYSDGNQQQRPMYEITRDGFCVLAMGFTGERAMKWKEAYINAFNQMEKQLIESHAHLPELVSTQAQLIDQMKANMEEARRYNSREVMQLHKQVKDLTERNSRYTVWYERAEAALEPMREDEARDIRRFRQEGMSWGYIARNLSVRTSGSLASQYRRFCARHRDFDLYGRVNVPLSTLPRQLPGSVS